MSDKSEKILVWGEASMILIALGLIGGWSHFIAVVAPLGRLFADKLFDVVLAFAGTILGYWLAKRHLEHFVSNIVKQMDAKHLELNRNIAFHEAVGAMLPELPNFHVRQSTGFSSDVATAVAAFTSWSTALDPTHTPEKSMELVRKEAYILATGLIKKDMGFKEAPSTPNYEWIIDIAGLAVGWTVDEVPDLSIYNWDTGVAACRHATMEEVARTATSIRYSWKWDMKDVPCGVYVGTVNFNVGGHLEIGSPVKTRVKILLKRENNQIIKTFEDVPWD
jgi:hypothetical protein